MKRLLIPAFALVLAGCGSSTPETPVAETPAYTPRGTIGEGDYVLIAKALYRTCDLGRAVYVYVGYESVSIEVVENAGECIRG